MFIHLPLIHFAPPRLLIDFKNSKWLTYFFATYYALLCICYCFSHLISLLSVTWLSILYKFIRFFINFLFLSNQGPMLKTLDYTIRIGSTPILLYFDLLIKKFVCLNSLHNRFYSCSTGDDMLPWQQKRTMVYVYKYLWLYDCKCLYMTSIY